MVVVSRAGAWHRGGVVRSIGQEVGGFGQAGGVRGSIKKGARQDWGYKKAQLVSVGSAASWWEVWEWTRV